MLRQIESDRAELASDMRAGRGKSAEVANLSASSQWWHYYEMSEVIHIALAMFRIGLVPEIARAAISGLLRRDLLGPLLEETSTTEIDPRDPKRALGSTWSLGNSLRAWVICGESLNRLVKRADNDDDALKLSVRLDPTTLFCKPVRQRIARAVAAYDAPFLSSLGEALQNPKRIQSEQYPELNASLLLLLRAQQLPYLNESRAEQLFLIRLADLRLYSGDRRSLIRYIQRFRDEAATKTP
jgi:hypothetical protein